MRARIFGGGRCGTLEVRLRALEVAIGEEDLTGQTEQLRVGLGLLEQRLQQLERTLGLTCGQVRADEHAPHAGFARGAFEHTLQVRAPHDVFVEAHQHRAGEQLRRKIVGRILEHQRQRVARFGEAAGAVMHQRLEITRRRMRRGHRLHRLQGLLGLVRLAGAQQLGDQRVVVIDRTRRKADRLAQGIARGRRLALHQQHVGERRVRHGGFGVTLNGAAGFGLGRAQFVADQVDAGQADARAQFVRVRGQRVGVGGERAIDVAFAQMGVTEGGQHRGLIGRRVQLHPGEILQHGVEVARVGQRARQQRRDRVRVMAQLTGALQLLDRAGEVALLDMDASEQEARFGQTAVFLQRVLELNARRGEVVVVEVGLGRSEHVFGRLSAAGQKRGREGHCGQAARATRPCGKTSCRFA